MSVLLVHQTFLSDGNAKHHNNFTYKILKRTGMFVLLRTGLHIQHEF